MRASPYSRSVNNTNQPPSHRQSRVWSTLLSCLVCIAGGCQPSWEKDEDAIRRVYKSYREAGVVEMFNYATTDCVERQLAGELEHLISMTSFAATYQAMAAEGPGSFQRDNFVQSYAGVASEQNYAGLVSFLDDFDFEAEYWSRQLEGTEGDERQTVLEDCLRSIKDKRAFYLAFTRLEYPDEEGEKLATSEFELQDIVISGQEATGVRVSDSAEFKFRKEQDGWKVYYYYD